ncbi:ATP synthase F1 subunit gamma [Candidatus Deferrimicrobium sp.]|uniref:ATP synthase F1 subunit gamma n=1 Tax=Candidatus Deferrimicrobium sp. TaxID=3060586 RepID=UPI002726D796|nr:ATP synthase F1 subunit gamma [Candidatus Deferrimicrobium sp.]MDO8739713.1 ATP synthase F1 subunit gamma [Candidatus Deferrimicrobium sp.]
MANLRAIRKRISSVKSTQQITRAMKMVSAAKLRRAQDGINAARPYARKMREVVTAVAGRAGADAHPLLTAREGKRLALLVVTSDRGLCGSFNSGLTRAVYRFLNEHRGEYVEITLFVVGRKGRDFFRRREIPIRKEYLGVLGSVSRHHAETVANELVRGFLAGEFDEVQIAFNEFRSAISQVVRFEKMFPIALESSGETGGDDIDYLYEPSREEILATLLPKYVQMEIFRVLLESVAGEHGARMTAMDSATNNSVDMISRLTLQMNRARQATITTELTEIVSGAEALKG